MGSIFDFQPVVYPIPNQDISLISLVEAKAGNQKLILFIGDNSVETKSRVQAVKAKFPNKKICLI